MNFIERTIQGMQQASGNNVVRIETGSRDVALLFVVNEIDSCAPDYEIHKAREREGWEIYYNGSLVGFVWFEDRWVGAVIVGG